MHSYGKDIWHKFQYPTWVIIFQIHSVLMKAGKVKIYPNDLSMSDVLLWPMARAGSRWRKAVDGESVRVKWKIKTILRRLKNECI